MQCILADPVLEVQPNFKSAAYTGWLNALVAGGMAKEDALKQMAEGWRLEHQECILERERAEKEAEEQLERRKAEKKKPKINDFDDGAVVADVIIPCPSQYAIQRIKNMESTSNSDDAFGFAKVDGVVALKTIASFKASQKALQDHDLSWWQFDLAKTSFLVHIEKNNWPQKHQQALALFFTLITNHKHRMRPQGEKALLCYTGFVHCEWHDHLAQDQGFNIGLFNNALYNSISDDIWEAERDEGLKMFPTLPSVLRGET
ncbi:hypothetical protein EDD22DRAFT_849773 [Suillus occidentalis]|nr:hypothetical protein EDD22DRAFT_849773 [Suillus occidentalis]